MIRTVIAIAAVATLAACSAPDSSSTAGSTAGVQVVAANYPAQFLVERVGGDLVSTTTLTAAGADPHDVELTPQQVGEIQDADALFYISEFQPAVDEAAQQTSGTAVDLAAGITLREDDEHGDEDHGHATDPHIWLDPELMVQMAGTVADSLSEADPANTDLYQANAKELSGELDELNQQFQKGTANCAIRTMVVSHEAFGYLADRYGFDQKGISGLSPETEPSASAIADLVDFVRDNGVTTVYTEVAVDPAVAQTIADEAGAATATLDPLGSEPENGDYLTTMRTNLETLRAGQSCT